MLLFLLYTYTFIQELIDQMKTGFFVTSTSLKVFYRYWPAINNQNHVILCIHGLACDSRIFNYFAERFSKLGCNVYAIDLPGYGNSDGEKGDVAFDVALQCMHDVVEEIGNIHGDKIFLLGFSLGGLYTLWYAESHPESIRGIVLLAPHLRVKGVKEDPRREPSKQVLFASFIKYFLTPTKKVNLSKAVPNAFGKLAGDEWIYMTQDPICNFDYSYRYIFNILINKAERVEHLYKIKLPLLILHGAKDSLPVVEQSKAFINNVASKDKQLEIFDDADHWFYHALFYKQEKYSEAERTSVIKVIDEWIRRRVS
jgi:alpha-beta hydrolase superfamily lysophospholipase